MATEARVLSIERSGDVWSLKTPRVEYETPVIVLACGTRARPVAALAGLDLPVHTIERQIFKAERVAGIPEQIPFVVDIDTGWYINAQPTELLLGGTATHRMPMLADAKIVRAYAGVRTLTPDHPRWGFCWLNG